MPHLRSALLLLALLACLLQPGCGPRPRAPIQIATTVWPGYEPLYLARDLGFLDKQDYRLVEMPNSTLPIRALRAGLVSGAALTLDEAFTLAQEGLDLRVVLVLDISHGADAILARPNLPDVKALKGRRVAVDPSAVGAYLLTRALDAAGFGSGDITPVACAQSNQMKAYSEGAVDAVVAFEPNRTRLLEAGARVVFDSRAIPGEIVDVLVLRAEAARQNPAAVARLRAAWFRALDRLQTHPGDVFPNMAAREGIHPDEFRRALEGLSFPDREAEARLRNGELLLSARRLSELMVSRRLLQQPVDVNRLFSEP
jgi:NitT/TauT family transport system substrate-binding protein